MTFPMAVLVATLYAFSRLASENEITGMKASGVSLTRLLVPVLIGGCGCALIMLGFNDQILPRANHRLATLQTDIVQKKPTFALHEQQMNEVSPGKLFLRTDRIDQASGKMRNVQIYDLSDPTMQRTIFADSGVVVLRNQVDLVLDLFHGETYEISKEQPAQLRHMYFEWHRSVVRGVANQLQRTEENSYRSDRERTICDMQHELESAEYEWHRADALALEDLSPTASPSTVSYPRPWRIGHAYCAMLAGVQGLFSSDSINAVKRPDDPTTAAHAVSAEITAAQERNRAQRAAAQRSAEQAKVPAGATANQPPPDSSDVDAEPKPDLLNNRQPALAQTAALESRGLGNNEAVIAIKNQMASDMQRYGVEIHKKFALAAACIVFILVGAPVALRFPRGGVGLVIGVSLVVFGLYYVGLIGGETLADRGTIGPMIAMWAPNIILSVIGILLLMRMGRESVTSRGGDLREMMDALRSSLARPLRALGIPVDRRHQA
jgi:lipopolysaccharide export system permease protein